MMMESTSSLIDGDILIVDDTKANLELLVDILQNVGYKVRSARNGKSALRSVKAKFPVLILLDASMPEMDGFEVCRKLKADDGTRAIPIIFITDREDTSLKDKVFQAGAVDCIAKPFHKEEVVARVKVHIGLRQMQLNLENQKTKFTNEISERKRIEDNLIKAKERAEESESRFRSLFENMVEGVAYCKMIFENENPIDFIYLEVNNAFEPLTGLKDVTGKRVSEVVPGISHTDTNLFQIYGRVALTGNAERFEMFIESLNDWYAVSVYSPQKEYFVAVFDVITERKLAEGGLKLNEARLESLLRIDQHPVENIQELLDFALDEAIVLTGSKIGYIYFYDENKKEFTLNTWSKEVMQQCTVTEPQTVYQLENTGIWGEAVRQRRPIMINDFGAPNPLKKGMPQGHAPLNKFLTIPVFSQGNIVAVVGVANKKVDYNDMDILQLQLMMDAVWKTVQRKMDEEKLRETRDYLEKFINYANAPIIVWDSNFKITRFNKAFERISGRNVSEVLGKEVDILFPSRTRTQSLEYIKKVSAGDRWEGVEIEIKHVEGLVYTLLWNSAAIYSADGKIVMATIAQGYDITKRKQALEALRESDDQFRLLLNSTAEAIYGIDLNGNCTFCNTACVQQLGYKSPDELIGKNMHMLIHYKHADGTPFDVKECRIFQAFRKGENSHVEDEVLWRADGTFFPAEYWSYPKRRDGKILGAVVTFLDITERKRTQEALRESEERFEKFMANLPAVAFMKDHESRLLFANPVLKNLFGWQDAVGKLTTELLPPDIARQMIADDKRILEKGPEIVHEKVLDINGVVHFFETHKFPFYKKNGEVLLGGISINETERKRAEENLVQLNHQLKELNATKDKFFSIIAHDLKSPFVAIIGLAELLNKNFQTFDNNKVGTIINAIYVTSKQTFELLENLLVWAQSQRGNIEFKPETFDFKTMAIENVNFVENQASKKNIQVTMAISQEILVFADKNMINTVVRNLLTNAIKFTHPEGKITISASSVPTYTEITITDTGVGMDEETKKKIFRIDAQSTAPGTENEKGTGIGLILCKEFVEKHNGKIWVESEPGKGSKFHFTLPKSIS